MSKSQNNNVYCIYKHTSPSGKCYIGQTKNYKRRCLKHNLPNDCTSFYRSIQKYGWENFKHEILEENLTLEEANDKEVFYIEFYNSLSPNGYNLKVGGENKRFSDETLEKMSKLNTGRTHSEETREKMRESRKFCSEELREKRRKNATGRKHSEESIEKTIQSKRKIWHIITPEGEHLIIKNLVEFCNENKFFNYVALIRVKKTNGLYKKHKIYSEDRKLKA